MAFLIYSCDTGSFTFPQDFELGNKVKIDGRGQETVLKKIRSTTDDMYMYEAMLDRSELIF